MIHHNPEEIGRDIGLALKNLFEGNNGLKYLFIILLIHLITYNLIVNFLL